MNTKYTPGPWKAIDDQRPYRGQNDIIAENGTRIGCVYGNKDEDCIANAKLVAAAPELLEALEWIAEACITDDWDNWSDNQYDKYKNVIDLINCVKYKKTLDKQI